MLQVHENGTLSNIVYTDKTISIMSDICSSYLRNMPNHNLISMECNQKTEY